MDGSADAPPTEVAATVVPFFFFFRGGVLRVLTLSKNILSFPNTRIWKTGAVITCNYTVITAL